MKIINNFKEEYDFLSNFYNCYVPYKGLTYSNSEAAFQAQKCKTNEERLQFTSKNASQSKRLGRKVDLRDDWEDIKVNEMKAIVLSKFTHNNILKKKLLETGNAFLEEGNWWNDTFWGVCKGKGENHLGKILMEVREELRNDL